MRKFPPLEGKRESTTKEMWLYFKQEALFRQLPQGTTAAKQELFFQESSENIQY